MNKSIENKWSILLTAAMILLAAYLTVTMRDIASMTAAVPQEPIGVAEAATESADQKQPAPVMGAAEAINRSQTSWDGSKAAAEQQSEQTSIVSGQEYGGSQVSWELEELALCVEAEAGDQPLEGRQMVVDVILNRVDDKDWPDTISGVIEQPYQFSVYWNGAMEQVDEPSELTWKVVEQELNERSYPGLYYFRAGHYHTWGTPWRKVGDHYFSTK